MSARPLCHRIVLAASLTLFAFASADTTPARGAPLAPGSIDPARTRAFAVGVLTFKQTSDWASFTPKGRRDVQMVEHLKHRGIAGDRITYLQDKQATADAVRDGLRQVVAAAGAGETLIVYYAGHGFLDKGQGYLAAYDTADAHATWLSMRDLVQIIEDGFHGERVLMFIDCCHSGRLAEDVTRRPHPRAAWAVFAASTSQNSSTGNWTFSQAVLDALSGNPLVDRNHDGRITAQEFADYIADEMTLFEEQLAAHAFTGGFDPQTVLSVATPAPQSPRYGERVKVKYNKEWWNGRIMATKGQQALIRWVEIGFDTKSDDEWVDLSTVRPLKLVQYPVGTKLEVKWKKDWYPAKVIALQGCLHQVRYDGYTADDDEWVPARRMRLTKQ